MIATGIWIDAELGLTYQVAIEVGPRGIKSAKQTVCNIADFDYEDVPGDVACIDRWAGGNVLASIGLIRVVDAPVRPRERKELMDKFLSERPAVMEACSWEAGLNAFIAAFGTDW